MTFAWSFLLGFFLGAGAYTASVAYREWRRARLIRSLIRLLNEISGECRRAEAPTKEYDPRA
jgi:hypothetical protein